jgi:endonuclease-3 related protein
MGRKNRNLNKNILEIYDRLFSAFGPQYWWPGETPFEIAVGAILTQNTNWVNVERAIKNLKFHNTLHARTLHRMQKKQLASLIRPAGYYNIKTDRLRAFLRFLMEHYRGSVERMRDSDTQILRENLLTVHGIGPETADSILLYALEKPIFVIDAYTKRIMQRHRLIPEKIPYHEIQDIFHKNLPSDAGLFNEYHALFVRLGKYHCKPKPKCGGCPLESLKMKK